jgi:hypothetical protein
LILLLLCPCWMLLVFWLCSMLLLLHSLLNTTAPMFLACPWHSLLLSQVLLYYTMMLSLFLYSLLFVICSTLLLLFILFQISISPLPSCFYNFGRSYPNSTSSCQTWKVRFLKIFVCWWILLLFMLFLGIFY